MKKLALFIVLALGIASISMVFADEFDHANGVYITVTCDTVTADYEDYGSWTRACSTGTLGTLDSGQVVTRLSGIAVLKPGQELRFSIDTAGGALDTAYSWNRTNNPLATRETMRLPFVYTYTIAADSDATIPSRVATFATGDGSDQIVIENILLEMYMISAKIN